MKGYFQLISSEEQITLLICRPGMKAIGKMRVAITLFVIELTDGDWRQENSGLPETGGWVKTSNQA